VIFRELNRGKCKTYLIGSEKDPVAILVDPIREKVDRYLALLAYYGLRLEAVIDTHTGTIRRHYTKALYASRRDLGVSCPRLPRQHPFHHR